MSQAKTTQDHGTIRQWAEERGGRPAAVGETRSEEDPGILRLDFEPKDEGLDPLSWDEFFQKFDSAHLTFLYQDEMEGGKQSRFHKFIEERH